LTRLDLSQNHIVTVTGIGQLTGLEYLDLSQNKLDYLPDDFSELVKLKELRVAKNKLTARGIPVEMFTPTLSFLDLSENNFTKLPPELAIHLSKLTSISLHGNHWNAPELSRIDVNTPPEDVTSVLEIYSQNMEVNNLLTESSARDPVNELKDGKERTKSIAVNVGGFLASKLNMGRSSRTSSGTTAEKTKQDEPESKTEQISPVRAKRNQNPAPAPAEQQTNPITTSPKILVSDLSQDQIKLPERTAAPLKQHSRAAGPKGRKLPSAEFIYQGIHDEPLSQASPSQGSFL
jgi:Leucine-rich repeat (LRR) protein